MTPAAAAHAVSEATRELAERVAGARAARTALRITGRGHWLDAGRPCRAAEPLDVGRLRGVVEYEPGDLTITARAGTSLAELARVTRAEGQWLPLDPAGSADGSIGATIATASAGPLASSFGTPRDQVLGCELVTGAGEVVRAGGRVVKNVAGFDLVRLSTGAWGTLGVVTEVSMRLRALPEVDRTLAVDAAAGDAWRWLRDSEYTPMAAELLSPGLAAGVGVGAGAAATLLLRLGGNAAHVRAAADAAGALGETRHVDAAVWGALAERDPHGAAVLRLGSAPSRVPALWDRAVSIVERAGGSAHATLARGVVRCVLPVADASEQEAARLRGLVKSLLSLGGAVVERLPAGLWPAVVPAAAMDPLSVRLRDTFDPDRILNPGVLGEPA